MKERHTPFEYYGDAFDKPDFYFPNLDMWLEVKEKTQRYNPDNWQIKTDGKTVFIMDEVSIRRMLLFGVNTAVIVRDNTNYNKMYFADILTLVTMPHKRVNRPVAGKKWAKGKWLLDFRNFFPTRQLTHLLYQLGDYSESIVDLYQRRSECVGEFLGETIPLLTNERDRDVQKSDVYNFAGE